VAVGIGSEGAADGDNGVASGGSTAFGDGRRPRHSRQRQRGSGRQQAMAEPTGRAYWQRQHGRRRLVAVAAAQPVAAADAQPGTVCHSGDRRRRRGATAPAVAARDGASATGSDGTAGRCGTAGGTRRQGQQATAGVEDGAISLHLVTTNDGWRKQGQTKSALISVRASQGAKTSPQMQG